MSGRRLRRASAVAALGLALGAAVGALAGHLSAWSVPVLVAAALLAYELADLARSLPSRAEIERPAVAAVVGGRLLVAALLAAVAATVALLAAAVPARHGLAAGLVGIAAAALLFLAIYVSAPRSE